MMRRERWLAVGLSMLAGYAYAIGFLKLSVIYASLKNQPSGRLAGHAVNGSLLALIVAALMVTFTLGVVVGSLVGHFSRTYRRLVVLALVSVLLAMAAWFGFIGMTREAIAVLLLSMGAVHAVLEKGGGITPDQEYAQALQKNFARSVGTSLLGKDWILLTLNFLLWLGFGVGAVVSVALFPRLDLGELWVASGGAALLALLVLATGATGNIPPSGNRSRH